MIRQNKIITKTVVGKLLHGLSKQRYDISAGKPSLALFVALVFLFLFFFINVLKKQRLT